MAGIFPDRPHIVPFDASGISTIRDLRELCKQVGLHKGPLR